MGVYLVGREGAGPDEKPRIIEARTAASAIAHASKTSFAATLINTKQAMAYAAQGIELEEANAEPAKEEAEQPKPEAEPKKHSHA